MLWLMKAKKRGLTFQVNESLSPKITEQTTQFIDKSFQVGVVDWTEKRGLQLLVSESLLTQFSYEMTFMLCQE